MDATNLIATVRALGQTQSYVDVTASPETCTYAVLPVSPTGVAGPLSAARTVH